MRRARKCERNSPADIKVSEEIGARCVAGIAAKIPLKSMEDHSGANMHTAAQGGPHAVAGGYTLKEAVAYGEPTLEQAAGRICGPVNREEPSLE